MLIARTNTGTLDVFLPFTPPGLVNNRSPNDQVVFPGNLSIRVNDSDIFNAPKPTVNVTLPKLKDWADFGPLVCCRDGFLVAL